MGGNDVATAAITVAADAAELPSHSAVAAAASGKAKRAQAAKILGGGIGKGKRNRRDAVTDRQHAKLKRAAAHFFGVTTTLPGE